MGSNSWLLALLVQLVVSAGVLMLALGWVTPGNPRNTFGRAVLVSLLLNAAWTLTLARFAWFLLIPLLLYWLVWLLVITIAYKVTAGRALLLGLALAFVSWLVTLLFGIHP